MPFVCGVVLHRVKIPLDKGRVSWPFARVDLGESAVLAHTPLCPRRVWSLRLPYTEISEAVKQPNLWGGNIRLRLSAPNSGDVSVVTVNDNYLKIADGLREKGVHVAAKPGRFSKRPAKPS
jgi:hypothetical protein